MRVPRCVSVWRTPFGNSGRFAQKRNAKSYQQGPDCHLTLQLNFGGVILRRRTDMGLTGRGVSVRALGQASNLHRPARGKNLPNDQKHHDHQHRVDSSAADPVHSKASAREQYRQYSKASRGVLGICLGSRCLVYPRTGTSNGPGLPNTPETPRPGPFILDMRFQIYILDDWAALSSSLSFIVRTWTRPKNALRYSSTTVLLSCGTALRVLRGSHRRMTIRRWLGPALCF